jgi:polyhydroxybutyrate depolymerase
MRFKALFCLLLALAAGLAQSSQAQDEPARSIEADEANPALTVGLEKHTLAIGGDTRTFFVHIPPQARGHHVPLLFVLHGGNGTAPRRSAQTGFNPIADREDFVVVYPQGINKTWNDGRGTPDLLARSHADDVAFFRAMIDALVMSGAADPARVYIDGGSNGGMMVYRLACEMSDRIAGGVAEVASLPVRYAPQCKPKKPMPLIIMAGTADPLMPFAGGRVSPIVKTDQGLVIPMMETVEFWRKADGCTGAPTISTMPDLDPADGMTTDVTSWTHCDGGAQLKFYKMNGSGHGAPRRPALRTGAAGPGGRITDDFDSSEEAWSFLKQFHR